MNKTFSLKSAEVSRSWYVIDASEAPLGRVATTVAQRLIGKHKPTYTPHIDDGDYVVVVNAAKVPVTGGNKLLQKKYYSHSGYPGGISEETLKDVLSEKPEEVIIRAVKGMLPKNKLHADRMARLKVFAGEEHDHTAQKPEKLGVKNG